MRRSVMAVVVLGALLVPGSAGGAEPYELPSDARWSKSKLTALIVPPNHGQVANTDRGVLNGGDPTELTPFNSYLRAIEDGIAQWQRGIDAFGADWLKAGYDVDAYVLGRDAVPPEVLLGPDILIATDEYAAIALGTAYSASVAGTDLPCTVRLSKARIESFSYTDMYNVATHEFGHCLGLGHIGKLGKVDPVTGFPAVQQPEHDVMGGVYTHTVGASGTHPHCVSNLDVLGLEVSFGRAHPTAPRTAGGEVVTISPDKYGDLCVPPPADWRAPAPSPSASASPRPFVTPRPSASPSTTHAPQSSPTPDASPGGEASPQPTATSTSTPAPSEEQGPAAAVTEPSNGDVMSRRSFKRVSGTADGDDLVGVDVALGRKVEAGCAWWNGASGRFIERSCSAPLWNDASGLESWSFRVSKALPAGRYKVLARGVGEGRYEICCEIGRNLVDFRLTRR